MIDINRIREKPEEIQKAVAAKGVTLDIVAFLKLDEQFQHVQKELQVIREERNVVVKGIHGKPTPEQVAKGKKIKESLDEKEKELQEIEVQRNTMLQSIPNPAKSDVKVGKDDSENEVLRTVGEPKEFGFIPKDHLELGEALDIIDVKKASVVSGARFTYLKKDGALLESALRQFAFDLLIKEEFIPVVPPVLIKKEIMEGLGYTAMGEAEDIFSLDKDGLYLVGTSEQSVVPLHMNDVLKKEDLPRRYVSYSTCFRREAGSYGKDTKGIFRVHQFNKVEMVSFVAEGDDHREHEYILYIEEKFFQLLALP